MEKARTSPQAFGELYEHYTPLTCRHLLHRTENVETAEDLTTACFEKALRHPDGFRWRDVSFSARLYRIATNTLVDHYRREGRRRETSLQDLEGVPRSPMGAGIYRG